MTRDAVQPGRLLVLRAAAMFDGVSPALVAGPLVMIAGRAIVAVNGPAGPVPAGAAVIDLPGLTLMPGLIDTHLHPCFDATGDPIGHLAQADDDVLRRQMAEAARRALRAGVTTVRDLGDRGYLALELRDGGIAGGADPLPTMAALIANRRRLHESGAMLVAGSDAGSRPPSRTTSCSTPPRTWPTAGLSPTETLQAMTSRAAQACGLGHRKGRIAPGFDADIIAVDGNPLYDLAAIRRLRTVFAGGRAIHPALGSRAGIEVP